MPTKVADIITQLSHHLSNFEEEFVTNYISKNTLSLLLSDYGFEATNLQQERNSLLVIIDELKTISLALQKNKIPFVVIKFSELPKLVSDIDILVHNTPDVFHILDKLGYSLEDDAEPHRSTYVKSINGTRVSLDLHDPPEHPPHSGCRKGSGKLELYSDPEVSYRAWYKMKHSP